ncbi:DUF397 domain-containing protein [Streptomyces griseoruber]|uniref:DUF397 domain-containing protein n=1 Tax=Streptomyces griseoruber TaxID=1943 RepID=UPI0037BA487B
MTTWIKSSHSGDNGGNCIEVSPDFPAVVPVRDSKTPDGPILLIPRSAWAVFVAEVRAFPDGPGADEDAIKRRKRASFLGWLAEGGLPDLTGPVEASASAGDPHRAV